MRETFDPKRTIKLPTPRDLGNKTAVAALAKKLKLRSSQRVLFAQTVGWPSREYI